jgi:hypothetical protein
MTINNVISGCEKLTFALNNTLVDSESADNGKDILIRCANKHLSLQVLRFLNKVCMMRAHDILPKEEFETVRHCCVRILKFDKSNKQNAEVFSSLCGKNEVVDFPTKSDRHPPQHTLDELVAKCHVTLFLLQCGSWESYENEQTLLKQVHRSLSMYIEEFLSLLISLSLFASFSGRLLVDEDLAGHLQKICTRYAKISHVKAGIAEKASESVRRCVKIVESLVKQ